MFAFNFHLYINLSYNKINEQIVPNNKEIKSLNLSNIALFFYINDNKGKKKLQKIGLITPKFCHVCPLAPEVSPIWFLVPILNSFWFYRYIDSMYMQ